MLFELYEQLAEQTHLSKSALGSYEADDFKDISHYALIKLAKFYGVTAGVLKAAHVREGDYFSSRVHHDIDAIMEDIRQAHRGRSDSAPENTIVDELKRDLEEVSSFKGSRAEQLLLVFCKQTKLRYSKLTEEEKQWLTRIVKNPNWRKAMCCREVRENDKYVFGG